MTVAIHISKADFCICCENVVEQGTGSLCPMCGSQAIRPLSAFLNREDDPRDKPCIMLTQTMTREEARRRYPEAQLPASVPELSEFIQVATPESIRKMLGYPQEQI